MGLMSIIGKYILITSTWSKKDFARFLIMVKELTSSMTYGLEKSFLIDKILQEVRPQIIEIITELLYRIR